MSLYIQGELHMHNNTFSRLPIRSLRSHDLYPYCANIFVANLSIPETCELKRCILLVNDALQIPQPQRAVVRR